MDLEYVREVFHPKLEQLKRKYFNSHPDEPIILHRSELLKAKYPFNALKDPARRNQFNMDYLELLNSTQFTIISVLIDKKEHNEGYVAWKYDPYHYCQEIILERYRLFLDVSDAIGDVMIESRGGKEDMRLKKSFKKLMDHGTQFLDPTDLQKVMTSSQLKVKPKSANISGLQLADLIAHPVRRWIFKHILNKTENQRTFGDDVLDQIQGKFRIIIKSWGVSLTFLVFWVDGTRSIIPLFPGRPAELV